MSKQPRRLPRGITAHRGRYRVRVSWEGQLWSLGVYDTLTDARAVLDIARGDIARGRFTPPALRRQQAMERQAEEERRSVTLAGWCADWLTRLEANPKRSAATVVSYRSVLGNHVLPALGDVPLADLTPGMVADWLAELAERPSRYEGGVGSGVVRNAGIVLRSAINAAVKAGLREPFAFPEIPAPDRVRPVEPGEEVATPAEVAALARAMPEGLGIAVLLAAYLSLRVGEVLGLQRRDLTDLDDPERATAHVRRQWNAKAGRYTPPKAGSSRSVAIPGLLLAPLREHLRDRVPDEPTARVVDVSSSALDHAWRHARDTVKPGFRFHDLRHTGLTLYAQQGATVADLLARGGHSGIEVAVRYLHATAARDRELTARLHAAAVEAGGGLDDEPVDEPLDEDDE